MKFSTQVLLSTLALPFVQGNMKECVSSVEAGKDYFPDKVQPEKSEHWSVTYEDTHKIVRNTDKNTTYLLYQCGTTPPADQSGYDAVLPVPIEGFGVQSTTYIPFFELLGKRTSIASYFGSFGFIYSPCLNKMYDDGETVSLAQADNATLIGEVGLSLDLPSFVGWSQSAFNNNIFISESNENGNLAIFEWIKFYSLFFNLEKEANEIYDATKKRYECTADNAATLSADVPKKPVVLWGSYSSYCAGWSVARSCPEYYCEFAQECGASLLTSTEGSVDSEVCGTNYMTTEEFVEFGKDADHWIYTSPDVNSIVYSQFKDELKDFVSVKNGEVYDVLGAGPDSWFEQRLAEPDAVLQDFCSIVGYENKAFPHKLTFLRHVESEIPTAPICTDKTAPLQVMGSACSAIAVESNPGTKDDSAAIGSGPQALAVLMLSAAIAMM